MPLSRPYLLLLLVAAPACSDQRLPPPSAPPTFPLTATSSSAEADGKSGITVSFSGASGAVTVTTTRGHFAESGNVSTVVDSAVGHATLMTCDSRATAGCLGQVRVSAVDATGASAEMVLTFTATENCTNGVDDNHDGKIDCADPECSGQSCVLGAMGTGTCDASGTCVCASGAAEVCNDGVDNNCDGQIDCADLTCAGKACKLLSGLNGVCNASACACPNMPEVCGDGIDNDCDGLVDCDDTDCQPRGNALGGVCDARGHTCAPPQLGGGTSLCNVCGGNGGTPQAHESSCGDNSDNDCDGLIDCQDPDCANVSCGANNKTCSSTTLQCTCATTVEDCNDHVDNNCDGLIDCADPQCANAACGPFGMSCGGGGAPATSCGCSGNGGVSQTAETSCADGRDNDCNGFVDCADPGCRPTGTDTYGLACGAHGLRCDATGGCVCPGGQTHESSCGDGQDNDCDGLVDCADPDCNGIVCSAVGGKLCSAGACTCPFGAGPETTCNDGIDNDCNGVADCNDPACNGQQCGPSGTQLCYGSTPNAACKDTTSQYALVLSAQRTAVPADGTSTVVITAKLEKDTTGNGTFVLQTNQALTFATSDTQAPLTPTAATTDANGIASTTLRSDASGGTARVTASYTIPGSTTVISAILDIAMPALGAVKAINQQYSVMGARYSGFQETNLITFQLLDGASNPYPAGLAVTFTHGSLGGSYIGNVATACAVGMSNCTTASGVTDGSGQVQVLLHAGTVADVVSVSAGAAAGGVSASGSASNIAVVGARASGAHISVDCTPKNVAALTTQDCTNSQYFGKTITCTASLADRFNNVLGVGTLTTFDSEAGAAGPPAMTPSYDPTSPPTAQVGLGRATDFISVGGYGLPVDVDALPTTTPPAPKTGFPAEYQLRYVDACGNRTHNPRDGLSTIVASAVGEEGFVDGSNGCPADGVYQGPSPGGCGGGMGENFVDSGEPFVDANDNGVRDANEAYVDANNNGKYDPPNGVWDANAVIWAQTRVLYTGGAVVGQVGGQEAFSRFFATTIGEPQSPIPTAPASFALPVNGAGAFGVYFVDGNFNPPAPPLISKYDVAKASGTITVALAQSPMVGDNVAMGFSQQYCARPNRSSFDPGNGRAAVVSVDAGSATLDGLSGLTAADVGNYLTLSGGASAGNNGIFQIAAVNSTTSVTIANANAVAADSLDWIDSQSDLTGCSATCQTAPCYVVPHVASFHYGAVGTASITAAAMPEAGESAQATCTTTGAVTAISISGQTN